MTPITLEDHLLEYLERANGCAQTLVSPPPAHCNSQVQGWYQFLKFHPFTWMIIILFGFVILQMSISAWFGDKH